MAWCLKTLVLSALLLGLVSAALGQDNEVVPPKKLEPRVISQTDNTFDTVIQDVRLRLQQLGWDKQQPRKVSGTFPISGSTTRISITVDGTVTNLGDIIRTKKTSVSGSILKGSFKLPTIGFQGKYTVSFPGVGQAPAGSARGVFNFHLMTLFCDVELSVDSAGIPVAVNSVTARPKFEPWVHDYVLTTYISNGSGDVMKSVFKAAIKDAVKQVLKTTCQSPIGNILTNYAVAHQAGK